MPTTARPKWAPKERPRFTGRVFRYVPHHATLRNENNAAVDGTRAQAKGGRWNPPGSFPVLYTSCTEVVAIAKLRHKHRGRSFQPWDLAEEEQSDLYTLEVDQDRLVDAVSEPGLAGISLPSTYPHDRGREVGWETTQPIGARLHQESYAGVACRSAADTKGEEVALFLDHAATPRVVGPPRRLGEWFPVPE